MSTTEQHPAPSHPRRDVIGLGIGGGLVLAGLSGAAPALASAPTGVPAAAAPLTGGLDLKSSLSWHLARRVCPAPTNAIAKEIAKTGYNAWIERQLYPSKIDDSRANKIISKHLSWSYKTTGQVDKASKGESWRAGKAMSISRTLRQIYTRRYLYESMVDTMGDHLYVGADGKAGSFAGWFDAAVLRKHALGKYSAMLAAAIHHPGMLIYLDNQLNSADNPNENLGRELLELHTVGVGNYTETDVRNSALLLTGHGLDWETYKYTYNKWDHYVGPLTIMGFSHANASRDAGPDALKKYLSYLAHHPATARHVCRRLAVRFVADSPSDALVEWLAQVYLANDTSLRSVMRALLHSDEFKASVGAKWRRPQELMSTMIKQAKPSAIKPKSTQGKDLWSIAGTVEWLLYTCGHQPRMWDTVNGYPDQARVWTSTQAMLANFDAAYARVFWGDKEFPVKSWATALGIKAGMTAQQAATTTASKLTGYTWSAADLAVLIAKFGSPAHVLTKGQIKDRLPVAVHLVFCSPYYGLR
jgi:uncharacterized protein (DUF1800 family)